MAPISNTFSRDADSLSNEDTLDVEQDLIVPDTFVKIRENLLLVSGLGLVLLATGMALTNLLS